MELYDRIRIQRTALGITQIELASRLGYSDRSTIAKIENGTNDIVQSKIAAFAKALETTQAYLMGLTDDSYDYEIDPEGRIASIPAETLESLQLIYDGDKSKIWRRYWDDNANLFTEAMANQHPDRWKRPASCPTDEAKLLTDYRSLNVDGKEYIQQTMEMAVIRYKKDENASDLETPAG